MNILALLRARFKPVLESLVDDVGPLLEMIRPAGDPKFGDYQANFAMGLAKKLGKNPRDLATEVAKAAELKDVCETPEVAGPGFINLVLRKDWIQDQLTSAKSDSRIGVKKVDKSKTYIVDFSSPNVAKPMHVGHIRSTVIGDSLCQTLRFMGHTVISDNHLGDWGTQFGMIIYGYKNFVDEKAYKSAPVLELSRVYRKVRGLIDFFESLEAIPHSYEKLASLLCELNEISSQRAIGKDEEKEKKAEIKRLNSQKTQQLNEIGSHQLRIAKLLRDVELSNTVMRHRNIAKDVLNETAKLHEDDELNVSLWEEFLPHCKDEIKRIYERLNVSFDVQLGESFYNAQLPEVVKQFKEMGLAVESQGAICVFLDGFKAPMIIQKQDGAYLYSTTDLATIAYRVKTWNPDAILYVVDSRQSDHFEKLFAAARLWGFSEVELTHVSFGTVMGEDGKPFKTRSGDTVGLEGLLDEAVSRARNVVRRAEYVHPEGHELTEPEQIAISEKVGIAALKYGDLSQNRDTDYRFSYDKMLNLSGNTSTYMQYAYTRVQSIFRRGGIGLDELRFGESRVVIDNPHERRLALAILRFSEALDGVVSDYRPSHLTTYLFEELAKSYSSFFDACPVLKAESKEQRESRLILCDLTARVIKQGLDLLGIQTVEKM